MYYLCFVCTITVYLYGNWSFVSHNFLHKYTLYISLVLHNSKYMFSIFINTSHDEGQIPSSTPAFLLNFHIISFTSFLELYWIQPFLSRPSRPCKISHHIQSTSYYHILMLYTLIRSDSKLTFRLHLVVGTLNLLRMNYKECLPSIRGYAGKIGLRYVSNNNVTAPATARHITGLTEQSGLYE